jgi:hypothetical protein
MSSGVLSVLRLSPDNLWALRDNQYLLFECKNQEDKTRKEINKDETGQMNNSCAWFKKHYGDSPVKHLRVIWTRTVGAAGGFDEPVEIVTEPCLSRLSKSVRGFFEELRAADAISFTFQGKDFSPTTVQNGPFLCWIQPT